MRHLPGNSHLTSISLRSDEPEGDEDKCEEQNINDSENPFGKVKEQHVMNPVLDEGALVLIALAAGHGAEARFPGSQRTGDTGEGFESDIAHSGKVGCAKVNVSDESPSAQVAKPDHDEPENDKGHEPKVDEQDEVGEDLKSCVTCRRILR